MSEGRILIAEDSEEIREVLDTYLCSKGYEVVGVDDGSKAAQTLQKEQFDIIISDINMPGLDGLELLNRAKQVSPEIPFVLITGFPSMENAIQAIRLGASDYITKPFKFNQIDLVLEKFVRNRQEEPFDEPHPKAAVGSSLRETSETQSEIYRQSDLIEELNEKLNSKVQELSKLYYISESISHINDEETLFQQVVQIAAELTESLRSYLLFRDGESGDFFIKAAIAPGIDDIIPNETSVEGNALKTLVSRKLPIISSGRQALRVETGNILCNLTNFLIVPLTVKKELFGAILVAKENRSSSFSQEDELIIMDLSRKMTLSLENTILYHTLYMHVINTLQALVASVEAKDAYTERHSQRVTHMAKKIAHYLGCSAPEIDSLEFAGLLHDIGKIGVRDTVLMKKEALTNEEWSEIRRHPEIGESIVRPLKLFSLEASIIRHHHERWDGKGYPDGLKETEIPFLSRIITVADSFDAMVSNRPYRPSKPIDQALKELERCKGTQFDPEIVDAFVDLFSKRAETDLVMHSYENEGVGMEQEEKGPIILDNDLNRSNQIPV